MSTRTTSGGRTATTGAGRFGRTAVQQSGRASRGAATRGAAGRGRSPQPQAGGRFGRSLSLQNASSPKPKRSTGTRSLPLISRKPQKKSGLGGALSALTGVLPTGGAAAAAKRGGTKPAGFALAAAAAGMAFRNRDKLAGMLGRGKQQQLDPAVPGQPQPTPPAV